MNATRNPNKTKYGRHASTHTHRHTHTHALMRPPHRPKDTGGEKIYTHTKEPRTPARTKPSKHMTFVRIMQDNMQQHRNIRNTNTTLPQTIHATKHVDKRKGKTKIDTQTNYCASCINSPMTHKHATNMYLIRQNTRKPSFSKPDPPPIRICHRPCNIAPGTQVDNRIQKRQHTQHPR